jgi:hypothetical protein
VLGFARQPREPDIVSQSERGAELVHQSFAVLPRWVVIPEAEGRWSMTMRLAIDTQVAESRMPQVAKTASVCRSSEFAIQYQLAPGASRKLFCCADPACPRQSPSPLRSEFPKLPPLFRQLHSRQRARNPELGDDPNGGNGNDLNRTTRVAPRREGMPCGAPHPRDLTWGVAGDSTTTPTSMPPTWPI